MAARFSNNGHKVKFFSEDLEDEDHESNVSLQDHGIGRRTKDEVRDLQKLVCFETNSLRCWRLVVVLLLLITGATIATLAFLFLRGEEEESFKRTYELFAERTKVTSEEYVRNVILSFEEVSNVITGAGTRSETDFPFVTVPFFEVAGYHARMVSGIELFTYSPIVSSKNIEAWNNYSVANSYWIDQGRDYLRNLPNVTDGGVVLGIGDEQDTDITEYIWREDVFENRVASSPPPHAPIWQTSPPPADAKFVNYDILTERAFGSVFHASLIVREAVFSEFIGLDLYKNELFDEAEHEKYHENAHKNVDGSGADRPHTVMLQPVFNVLKDRNSAIVGILQCSLAWDQLIHALATDGASGIFAVISNSCGQSYTYQLGKSSAKFLGEGDLHDPKWDSKGVQVPLAKYLSNATELEEGHCVYFLDIYPSDEMREEWVSSTPLHFAYVAAGTFLAITITFFIYDFFVRRRQNVVVQAAARSNKIVASLFPSNVRDRLLAEGEGEQALKPVEQGTQTRLKDFLANDHAPDVYDLEETDDLMFKTKPIADLFTETTILFADIAGFTAWSSAREPSQVFTLLETVYRAFDVSAQRRRIFKVETVGDCYVAASGIPEPRKDHAVAMARFAKECMAKMQALTRRLEVTLGPDTADLAMRMGLHSGPVTAGVLRGERSRFQLFGDTMNTASRMESTGSRNRIQISQETADLLYAAGKGDWIVPRDDLINAKGKGEMKTYWIDLAAQDGASITSGESDEESNGALEYQSLNPVIGEEEDIVFSDKALRLIDWNVDLLIRMIKLIIARRQTHPPVGEAPKEMPEAPKGHTVLDEVSEIVVLPEFDYHAEVPDPNSVLLEPDVELQLYEYVTAIASMYRKNPFHNFEHASHVTMSVAKLLSRIVAPSDLDFKDSAAKDQSLHDHTYGITSDPLTQFACVFSALIHDVDHTGVPNTQLVKENHKISNYYKGRSVAEQNSVDIAWDLLMQEEFEALRGALYSTDEELKRFRQLVVNCVMATDIMDKDLKQLRNARWDKAFTEKASSDSASDAINRKATIVIEHLLQASDVSHTMQHWHIYRKWNANLFEEMTKAFLEKRSEKDPAEFWYKGELGFFDFYIIPLAKKLKECGVFGVSSDEYLQYAEKNRKEWEARGQEVVSELVEKTKKKFAPPPAPETAPESSRRDNLSGLPLDITITATAPDI